jgi:hypothetical protein
MIIECWVVATVEAWASGHTHFNCTYTDKSGKAIISNQKGSYFFPQKTFNAYLRLADNWKVTISKHK